MLSLTSEKFLTYDFELKARTQEKVPIYSVLFFLLLTKYIHSTHSHYAMYMIKMNSFSKTMLSRRRNRLNRSQSDSKQNEHFQCIPIPLNVRMHNLIPQIMSLKTLTIPLFSLVLVSILHSVNHYLHIIFVLPKTNQMNGFGK